MKFSIQLALSMAAALVAIIMAYAELRHGVDDLQNFKKEAQASHRTIARKVQRLEIHVSHLQSWLDDAKVKR